MVEFILDMFFMFLSAALAAATMAVGMVWLYH